MTVTSCNAYLRWIVAAMISVLILVSPLSLASMQHEQPKSPAYEEATLALEQAQQTQWGMKQSFSQHRLLPLPVLQFLFVILSLIAVLGVARVLLFMYPSIFLLRKIEFLLPMKFTSIYVGHPSKS